MTASQKKPTLSIAVMAHKKREHWFPYLKNILGDVEFVVDDEELQLGTWKNCKRAWQKIDRDCDYGLVIQDDAILCENFLVKTLKFIEDHPNKTYQLFFGNRKYTKSIVDHVETKHLGYVQAEMMWGIAICLPTRYIDSMIKFGDFFPESMPDDSRIRRFCVFNKLETFYPWPSLVDHRQSESLVNPKKKQDRVALNFDG